MKRPVVCELLTKFLIPLPDCLFCSMMKGVKEEILLPGPDDAIGYDDADEDDDGFVGQSVNEILNRCHVG